MANCPSSDTLQLFLCGATSATETDEVRHHVDLCSPCTALLSGLADDPELRTWRGQHAPSAHREEEGLRCLLGRLHGEVHVAANGRPEQPTPGVGRLGSYHLLSELGRGGMGIVFLARDESLRRTVAIKVLRPERAEDPSARAHFVREAQAAARVNHENVANVHAVFDPPEGPPYLVMEYLAGPTLQQEIVRQKRLSPRLAAGLCAQVANALEAAHAAGLIHRDVKPSNVLLANGMDGSVPRVKLVDFGLARIVTGDSGGLTQDGTLAGTPAFVSPEQVRHPERLDARTDTYSLGVTLYVMLTGEEPFRGSLHRILEQVAAEDPLPPSRLNEAIPLDLETICTKAMAKEPDRRYVTAAAFAADLQRFLAGEPVLARRVGPLARTWRWCRRNPRLAAMTGMAAGLLLLLTVGSMGSAWRIAQERQAAVEAAELAERNAKAARAHAAAALAAVNTLIGGVQEQLDARPGTLPLRRLLADEALTKLEHIAAIPEQDPAAEEARFVANYRMGDIYVLLGRTAEARRHFDEALRLASQRHQANPGGPSGQRDLALARERLGDLAFHGGQLQEAQQHGDAALLLREELARAAPTDTEAQRAFARVLTHHGRTQAFLNAHARARDVHLKSKHLLQSLPQPMATGVLADFWQTNHNLSEAHLYLLEIAEAKACAESALAAARQLTAQDPLHVKWQRCVADSLVRLAEVAVREELSYERAVEHQQAALVVRERLAAADPDNVELRRDVAAALFLRGNLGRWFWRFDEGEAAWRETLQQCEQLVQRDPNSPQSKRQVFQVCLWLAELEYTRERPECASPWIQRAQAELARIPAAALHQDPNLHWMAKTVDLVAKADALIQSEAYENQELLRSEPPELVGRVLAYRGYRLARQGRHVEAAATAEALRRLGGQEPDQRESLARIYALCARAVAGDRGSGAWTEAEQTLFAHYAEAAVAAMRVWLPGRPHSLPLLAMLRVLDVLRDHPSYKVMLADLKAAQK